VCDNNDSLQKTTRTQRHWPCPFCNSSDTRSLRRTYENRTDMELILWRQYRCKTCGNDFYTFEAYGHEANPASETTP
jgi:hypothetical protein